MFSILAAVSKLSGNGEIVTVTHLPIVAIAPFVLVLVIFALIFSFGFYKKRLEHRQIMAAIEKGIPLSELRPAVKAGPTWIRNLTAGITLLIIGIGLACILLVRCIHNTFGGLNIERSTGFFIAAVLFAIGISRIIHGLLLRKTENAQQQIQLSDKINAEETKT